MQPRTSLLLARIFAASINLLFITCSACLIGLTFLATINPPPADVAPVRVDTYPQYVITLFLIAAYAVCLFMLSSLGILSLCVLNSFLLSVHILCQIAMLIAQLVAIAFTVTVRKRVHGKLEESWQEHLKCTPGSECEPLKRFLSSEMLLIFFLCFFLIVQVCLLVATGYLAEKQSSEERSKLQREKDEDDD
ncbi:unnamed protein product [Auanema sp. JU1783]|nr:unnamed protein product [Auanema sp. JU1783]